MRARMIDGQGNATRQRRSTIALAALSAATFVLAACSSTAPPPVSTEAPGISGILAATPAVDLMCNENPDDYRVNVDKPDGLTGDVFYTIGRSAAVDLRKPDGSTSPTAPPSPPPASTAGVRIMSKDGHILWGWNAPNGKSASNFRTQMLDGKPVLTWWVGSDSGGHGTGEDYIVDRTTTSSRHSPPVTD